MTDRDVDIVAAANHVASVFEAMDYRIIGVHILSDDRAQVSTDSYDLVLELNEDVPTHLSEGTAPFILSLLLAGNSDRRVSHFARDAILARCLQALNEAFQPDFVQWTETGAMLPSESFAMATKGKAANEAGLATNTKETATRHKTLPDVEATNAVLQDRISNHDPDIFDSQSSPDRLREIFSDGWIDPELVAAQEAADAYAREMEDIEDAAPLRLSAWLMSFSVALIALPVGIALLIINLAKGENLRLSSQTAALTGTFVAFQTLGTTANAMEVIQNFLS